MESAEFYDLIAISEVTPGSISINSATYIGYQIGGLLGSIAATIGVVMPSLIIIFLITRFLMYRYSENNMIEKCLYRSKTCNFRINNSSSFFCSPDSHI